jgi:hypothetical protein
MQPLCNNLWNLGPDTQKKADKFKSWNIGKKAVKTKGDKSGRAEADTLDEARHDANSRQSAVDERGTLGEDNSCRGGDGDG